MRKLDADLATHLDGAATTLCHCLRLTRNDGVHLGLTDHDHLIAFEDTEFRPESGITLTSVTSALGLSTGGLEMAGALSSDDLTEADLAAGLYDNARVELWLVNWARPAERHRMAVGRIGEVRRDDGAFTAEVRSLSRQLDSVRGRRFGALCDADLGDRRCGIDLDQPAYKASGAVTAIRDGRRFSASGLEGFDEGWFARGLLTWTSGANAGRSMEIKAHRISGGTVFLDLWLPMSEALAESDGFTLTAGCDKHLGTCVARFANAVNFQGFPHLPGNDFALSYPSAADGALDGGRLGS